MPIHIIRDVALTIRSFYKRITDFVKYRQATRDMNDRYPDATVQDIGSEDLCIICREGMRPWQPPIPAQDDAPRNSNTTSDERLRPKKLPCGHILHFACLRSWLERQQNCPTCRAPVLAAPNTSTGSIPTPQPGNRNGRQALPNAPNAAAPIPVAIGNQAQGAAQNRIRFFNFGPFRVGFGAGELHAMEQGLRMQPPTDQQQPMVTQLHSSSVQAQLQLVEQQLMQEINSLQARADQLWMVRALQGELVRLRIAQTNGTHVANPGTTQPSQVAGIPNWTAIQAFDLDPSNNPASSDTSNLPPGFTVPEGWTVMPLRRLGSDSSFPGPSASSSESSISHHQSDNMTQHTQQPTAPVVASNNGWLRTPIPPNQTDLSSSTQQTSISQNQAPTTIAESSNSLLGKDKSQVVNTTSELPIVPTNLSLEQLQQWGTPGARVRLQQADANDSDMHEWQAMSTDEPRASKGKGRATTIEDLSEDDD